MANEVTLGASIRTNLLTLQKTGDMVNRTNGRLSSGLKVASAMDDAVAYFQAKGLRDRGTDLATRKDSIDQGISTLTAAMNGLEAVEKVMVQMKGIVLSAKSATDAERKGLSDQLISLAQQLNHLANDASYQGLNLINTTAANLSVQFSEKTAAQLDVAGVDVRVSHMDGLTAMSDAASAIATGGLTTIGGADGIDSWTLVSNKVSIFDNYVQAFDTAISNLRTAAKTVGANVALLQTRSDFTKEYINTLKIGADKLTLADLNEEGANLVSLQTRQQLGIQALSFAGQSEQGVLSLFR